MKRIIIQKNCNIIQVTQDEVGRWYFKNDDPSKRYPSVTWITGHYPKGMAFYKWLASTGWDESQAIKQSRGIQGSKVHQAINDLLNHKTVKISSEYYNDKTENTEPITLDEWRILLTFVAWYKAVKPVTIATEITVFNESPRFAGTIDYVCKINDKDWMIDFKISPNIWTEYELQISAYKHGYISSVDPKWDGELAILQLGYNRNKQGWKFTNIDDNFGLFLPTYEIWKNENVNVEPETWDLPTEVSLEDK